MRLLPLLLLLGSVVAYASQFVESLPIRAKWATYSPPIIKKWFKRERVVPDVLDHYPPYYLEVLYPERRHADLANTLSIGDTEVQPKL
jgi:hypothetical protein